MVVVVAVGVGIGCFGMPNAAAYEAGGVGIGAATGVTFLLLICCAAAVSFMANDDGNEETLLVFPAVIARVTDCKSSSLS